MSLPNGGAVQLLAASLGYAWNSTLLEWVPVSSSGGGGGGGGTVDQGAAGLDPWLVSIDGVPHVIIDSASLGTVTVTGALTDAELRAVPVPVSGTVNTKTGLTANTPTSASVGVASAQIVASNASRKGLVLKNRSDNIVSFGFGSTAVLDSGITLEPGQDWQMSEYTFHVGAVNAIAGAAASLVTIQEYQ